MHDYSFVVHAASAHIAAIEANFQQMPSISDRKRKEHPVSSYHAYVEAADTRTPTVPRLPDVVTALRNAILAASAAFRSAAMQWWTRRRIARLSDRMLRDFGFERDWDGSIRSLRDLD